MELDKHDVLHKLVSKYCLQLYSCTAPEKSFLHRSEEKRLCTVKEILRLSGWLPDSVEKNLRLLSCLYSCETYLSSRRTHLPSCLFSNFLGPRKCTFSPAAVMKMASFSDSFLAGIWFGCGRTFNWSHSSVLPHEEKNIFEPHASTSGPTVLLLSED